jgi:hypothetical protein
VFGLLGGRIGRVGDLKWMEKRCTLPLPLHGITFEHKTLQALHVMKNNYRNLLTYLSIICKPDRTIG